MDRFSEIAKHSQNKSKNSPNPEKKTNQPSSSESSANGTLDPKEDANKALPSAQPEEKAQNNPGGSADSSNKTSAADSAAHEKQKSSKSSLRDKLKSSDGIEMHRKTSGVVGGLSASGEEKKIVKANESKEEPSGSSSMGLINKGSDAADHAAVSSLKGGIENKTATTDINSGRINKPVKSFNVAGGLGSSIGDHIESTKHTDVLKKQDKPIRVDTNAGKTDEPHHKPKEDSSVIEHKQHKNKEDKKTEGIKDESEKTASLSAEDKTKKDLEKKTTDSKGIPESKDLDKPKDSNSSKGPTASEGLAASAGVAALGGLAVSEGLGGSKGVSSSESKNINSVPGSNTKTMQENSVKEEIKDTEKGQVRTQEINEKKITEDVAPLNRNEAEALGVAGAAGVGALGAAGLGAAGAAALGDSHNAADRANVDGANSKSDGSASGGSGGSRKYETKPECSQSSELMSDRKNNKILYEADVYKKKYFLQFLWTKRHFTLSNEGIMKYYRNVNSKRRGEFDVDEYFTSFNASDVKGKHPYRINMVSDKSDDLGFDSKEQRDEFLYWLDKSTE
ncbi:hypothetical protein NEMIN01_0510 [Nematocida minor]|uniref:uncharacterized protein n=1 Tax=Nematocida minor TaxID=1912983 RepID=UPI00221E3AEF|nr:uncharacterized protein NEMIN01_0510 [Nematocida minor]KAI5189447.1 hypothetical protein NEMIN01_0510 [Nematocida minor]